MALSNYERMLQLASDTFAVQNDPQQLNINESVIEQLQCLHPSTLSEYSTPQGPASWVLLIPTTREIMDAFLGGTISEKELLDKTPPGTPCRALYLCSAMTLPEFRNQGLTKKIALRAIEQVRKTFPIEVLFVWNFSPEGAWLARSLSKATGLPLLEKNHESNIREAPPI